MRPRMVKKKRGVFSRILYWLMFLAFSAEVFYVLFFSDFLNISKIEIKGAEEIDPQSIRNIIDSQLSGKYFNFIRKNNLLLLNSNKIKDMALNDFKKIKNINIKKDFKKNLFVNIIERESKIIFCSNSCFIIDEDGVAFLNAEIETEKNREEKLLIFTNESGREFNLNEKIIEPEFIDYLYSIKDKLKSDLELEIEQEIRTPQLISNDIRVKMKEGWTIYFFKEISPEKEIEMLKVVLNEKIEKDKRNDLEYIDLRTNNKVFYKLKNSDQQQSQVQENPQEEIKKDDKKTNQKKKS